MGEVNGFLPVYTSREFDPRWFCVWEIFVLLSRGASGGTWILDSQSLFVLIRQHNLEVSLQVDHRFCLFVIILSLNNKNLKKKPKLVYLRLIRASCGGWGWGSVPLAWKSFWLGATLRRETSLKALHGNTPARLKIRFSLWKFSFGWASLHIWQLLPPSPLPRTLLRFQKKKGVWSPAAPPSSPLQATSETSAKSLSHRLRVRPDVLSSLSVHLQAVSPGASSPRATVRQILISSQGWEERQENAACQHWLDWLVKSM